MTDPRKPEWAQKIEDWGKRVEDWGHQFEKDVKKAVKPKKPKWKRKGEFVGDVMGNIIALYIVNFAPNFFPDFFASDYAAVLWVFNVVLIVNIAANIVLLIFSPKYLYYLFESLLLALSVVSMLTMITLFPFNVPNGLDTIIKIGLSFVVFIVSISAISHFVIGAGSVIEAGLE